MHQKIVTRALLLLSSASVALVPHSARAQSAQPRDRAEIGDIVVTATRQASIAQNVPIAITAIDGDQLARQGIVSAGQLSQLAPSLYVQTGLYDGSPRFSVRGLSTNDSTPTGTSPVAIYVDDVYQASQFGSGPLLFDLQRVEILRGPQGTLFGRNTTGGAVSYFSQTPTNKVGGYVRGRAEFGDQDSRGAEGAINLPLIDNRLAMRFSFMVDDKDNYVHNIGTDTWLGHGTSVAGRFQLRWTPDSDTRVNLSVFGVRRRGDPPIYRASLVDPCSDPFAADYYCTAGVPNPLPAANDDKHVDYGSRRDLHENYHSYGATLRIEHDFAGVSLTSITGWKKGRHDYAAADSGSSSDSFHAQTITATSQVSEELRLASDADKPVSGVLGAFFGRDKTNVNLAIASTEGAVPLNYLSRAFLDAKTTSYAGFGNITFKLNEQFSLVGGLRYSHERRSDKGYGEYFGNTGGFGFFFGGVNNFDWTESNVLYPKGNPPIAPDLTVDATRAKSFRKLTWDATLNYKPAERVLLYARYARGFRSGGFSLPASFAAYAPPSFGPETLDSYELGLKSDLFGRKLRVNANVYHYNFTNQQVFQLIAGNLIVTNAGTSKVDGAELEVTAQPVAGLELHGTAAYSNARFTKYVDQGVDYSGNRLQQAPKWTFNGSAMYHFDLGGSWELTPSTNWSYRSRIFFEPNNLLSVSDRGRATGDVRLSLDNDDKGLSIAGYIKNVTNQRPITYAYSFAVVSFLQTGLTTGIGRVFGVELGYKW